jgi:uncharacterized membrane protein YraQ (UPF0718 family)
MISYVLTVITLIALAISFTLDRKRTGRALRIGVRSLTSLAPVLLGMMGMVGLVLALIPPQLLSELFKHNGTAGFALVAVVGALITIPAPVAFPLAGSLVKLGASLSSMAAFITTLTMVGVLSAPMEIACFGKRFTLVRQSLSFVLAIAIGGLMGVFL